MKIKVAIVEPVGGYGGMKKYNNALKEAVVGSGVDAVLFTSLGEKDDKNFFNGTFDSKFKALKVFYYLRGILKTCLYVLFGRYNIIHLHLFHYGVKDFIFVKAFNFLNIPVVATLHDVSSFSGEKDNYWREKIFSNLDGSIVHSQVALDELSDIVSKSSTNLSTCKIYHGSYSDHVKKHDKILSRKKLSIDENKKIFLFIGQIKEVKGLDILLNALRLLPDVFFETNAFIVAGRPWKDDFSKYKTIIDENGLVDKVDLRIGFVEEEDIDFFYSSADFVILPYRKVYQSGVLLSTMSYQKVAICSDINAIQEIVFNRYDGFEFESENERSLADVLIECSKLTDSDVDLIGARAERKMSTEFSWEQSGKLTVEYYRKILKGREV